MFDQITTLDKVFFASHLSIMLKAGLPLREGVATLREQTTSKKFKKILGDIIKHLDNGEPLGDSLAKYPRVFSQLFTNIIKAGEASGTLEPQPEAGLPQVEEQQEIVPEEKIVPEEAVPEEEEELVEEKIIKVVVQAKISRLNVRKGPGISYPIIAKVYPGEVYQLLQEQDEWYKINIDEQTQGWVFARYVSKQD